MKKKRRKSPRRIPTSVKLVNALKAQNDPKLKDLIEDAAKGLYDDFRSMIAFPMVMLVDDLRVIGREDLAKRAINGEWDGQRWEAEEWFEKEGQYLLLESNPEEDTH